MMLAGVALLTGLGLLSALMLVAAHRRFAPATDELTTRINRLLPQTQCAQCGYPGCRPYAEAIARGDAINKCPPGGQATIDQLAGLLGREPQSPDPDYGTEAPAAVASIREAECIGCTLCVAACPVDAIIGAAQQMHTVIESDCTGCDLCREPCPVDCIDLLEQPAPQVPAFPEYETPCINCGFCAEICPRHLHPQLLLLYREDSEHAQTLRLDDCIECRLCDSVCPSEIPLTGIFATAKAILHQQKQHKAKAAHAEARYLARKKRIALQEGKVAGRPSASDRADILDSLREEA